MLGIQQVRRNVKIAMQHRPGTILPRVSQYRRSVAPAQPVFLQMQTSDHLGGSAQRIEGAERVGHKTRIKFAITAHGAADVWLCLEEQGVPTSLSQPVGGHQSIRTGANDNRIYFARQGHSTGLRPVTATRAPET